MKKAASAQANASAAQSVAQKEEEELAKAIKLSLKETSGSGTAKSSKSKSGSKSSSKNGHSEHQKEEQQQLFGSLAQFQNQNHNNTDDSSKKSTKKIKKMRALYDFEAVEDNEITFRTGDVLYVVDQSDENWWKGYLEENPKDEGLFPSNFVTKYKEDNKKGVSFDSNADSVKSVDKLDQEQQKKQQVQAQIAQQNVIDEQKIDECIELLQNADPTGEIEPDTRELLELEDQCYMMGPLIDKQLQKIDHKHAVLDDVNMKILEAFQIYNNLMKESVSKQAGMMSNSFQQPIQQNQLPIQQQQQFDPNFQQQSQQFNSQQQQVNVGASLQMGVNNNQLAKTEVQGGTTTADLASTITISSNNINNTPSSSNPNLNNTKDQSHPQLQQQSQIPYQDQSQNQQNQISQMPMPLPNQQQQPIQQQFDPNFQQQQNQQQQQQVNGGPSSFGNNY